MDSFLPAGAKCTDPSWRGMGKGSRPVIEWPLTFRADRGQRSDGMLPCVPRRGRLGGQGKAAAGDGRMGGKYPNGHTELRLRR